MKKCSCCGISKPVSEYYADRSKKSGLSSTCKDCSKNRRVSWRATNKKRNSEYVRGWKNNNRGKWNAIKSKHNTAKSNAAPVWLTDTHYSEISLIYEMAFELTKVTGILYHVDHIFPLQGKNSSGLHVPWNLQIIPASENIRKSNKVLTN